MTLSAQKNTSNKHKAVFEKEYGFFAYIKLKIAYKWKDFMSRKTSNEDLYYLYNGHADVTMLVNKAGDIKATYYYDAFK